MLWPQAAIRLALLIGVGFVALPLRAAPPVDLDREPRSVTFVGYLHDSVHPAVTVTTNEPVRAHLSEVDRSTYLLHLEHAVLSRGVFGLPVDASCFGGPIASFVATPQEEPDTGVTVAIKLQRPARLHLRSHGRNLFLTAVRHGQRGRAHR